MPLPSTGRPAPAAPPPPQPGTPVRAKRAGINEVLPGRLYQRGQILTWQREKKYELFTRLGIHTVINFWPKMDPDLAESPAVNYLQLSAVQSEMMLERRMDVMAAATAGLLAAGPGSALVLCEAGKTRSVYFCILVVSRVQQVSLEEARRRVLAAVGPTSLKGFMLDRIRKG